MDPCSGLSVALPALYRASRLWLTCLPYYRFIGLVARARGWLWLGRHDAAWLRCRPRQTSPRLFRGDQHDASMHHMRIQRMPHTGYHVGNTQRVPLSVADERRERAESVSKHVVHSSITVLLDVAHDRRTPADMWSRSRAWLKR